MSKYKDQKHDLIFALDIGTRSIVGVVGKMVGERFKVLDMEQAEHGRRYMLDGQIDNIEQVGMLARTVTERLEQRLETRLQRVCVAAAGRALRTQSGTFSLDLDEDKLIDAELISRLEAGAVTAAEQALLMDEEARNRLFLVGYTVSQYRLDHYPLSALQHHSGKKVEADVVATFLPGEVVESLYEAMRAAGLQVSSMTLEPIAAMNAAIPADLRLLNLAMVDIGAGTTDIAICKDGSVVGYTMVTLAGDEITEALMRAFLVDFQTAEQMKRELHTDREIQYTNILGIEECVSFEQVTQAIAEPMERLADAIAKQVLQINGTAPSALYLAGGGSKLNGLNLRVARSLQMEEKRVAIAGHNFVRSAFADHFNLDNPEYTTPLGIAISAGMGLLNDSYVVMLNGEPAKLFRNGTLTLRDVLQMNGYSYTDMMGRTGKSLSVTLDGKRMVLRGEPAVPAILTVNGEEAAISNVIHAGDEIQFVPARNGTSATTTLRQLLDKGFQGKVLVNNEEVSLDTELCQGDVILTIPQVEKVPPVIKPSPQPPTVPTMAPITVEAVQTIPVEPEVIQTTQHTWTIPAQPIKPIQTVPTIQPTQQAFSVASMPPTSTVISPRTTIPVPSAPVQPQPVPAPTMESRKELHIRLNDMPMTLLSKENGLPHYLMDLLQYSGIDFDHIDRPVRLEVNGEECGFQYILKEDDHVIIRCVEN